MLRNNSFVRVLVTISLFLIWVEQASAAGVPRQDCFPVERVPQELRQRFEEQLLAALDSLYLYTIVGGLKPMTDGELLDWPLTRFFHPPDTSAVRELQALLPAWRCGGEIEADVFVSWMEEHPTKGRGAALRLVNRPAYERAIERNAAAFALYGFTPATNPWVLHEAGLGLWYSGDAKKRAHADRMRGYLYGFPDHAVELYYEDGLKQTDPTENRRNTSAVRVPTVDEKGWGYKWWVAKGQENHEQTRALLARAGAILAEYKRRRDRYVGPGKPGVVALLRDWFDDGKGRCAPSNAQFGARPESPGAEK